MSGVFVVVLTGYYNAETMNIALVLYCNLDQTYTPCIDTGLQLALIGTGLDVVLY